MCDEVFDSAKSRGMHRRWNHDNPWENKEQLREQYIGKRKNIPEIAEMWSCGETTIEQWLNKHNIETRNENGVERNQEWMKEANLRQKYIKEKMSISDIANHYSKKKQAIRYYIEKHEIPRRDKGGKRKDLPYKDPEILYREYYERGKDGYELAEQWDCPPNAVYYHLKKHEIPTPETDIAEKYTPGDYEYIKTQDEKGNKRFFPLHRLVAYAHGELDGESVFDYDTVIHHKDEITWNNSPNNLVSMARSEHTELHTQS